MYCVRYGIGRLFVREFLQPLPPLVERFFLFAVVDVIDVAVAVAVDVDIFFCCYLLLSNF